MKTKMALAALFIFTCLTVSVQAQQYRPCVGIGTPQNNTGNSLLVSGSPPLGGNVAIGKTFCMYTAPADGVIIEGNVGIGTPMPGLGLRLDVLGNANVSGQFSAAGVTYPIALGSSEMVLTTNGIGTASWAYPLPKTYANQVYPVLTGTTNSIVGSFGTTSTSFVSVTGSTLTLDPGTYVITASGQLWNDVSSGTNSALFDGTNYFGAATVSGSYFGGWSATVLVTITSAKTYTVVISTNLVGYTAYARNVTITALKVQQ